MSKYTDRDWLYEQYVSKERQVQSIADECDCHYTTIYNWINEFNFEKRETPCEGKYTNEDWLREKYHDEKLSTGEVGDICGVTGVTIRRWLKKFDIRVRTNSEAVKLSWEGAEERRKELSETAKEWDRDHTPWPENCTDDEYEAKCKEIQKAILEVSDRWSGDNNPAKREEVREKISKSHLENPRNINCEFVEKLGHNVRSSWEKEVGLLLSENDIEYDYEGENFKLKEGCRYVPDFILDGYVIEVKGQIFDKAKEKAKLFMQQYDGCYIVVGTEMPCDVHIPYRNREKLIEVVEEC